MAITRQKSVLLPVPVAPRHKILERFDQWLNQERTLGYVLLVPALILLAVFVAYPFAFGVYIAHTDARIGNPGQFVGFDNFIALASDAIFRQTVFNSFLYTIVTTIFKLILGMAMALLLNQAF